jgi:hypothetical protein
MRWNVEGADARTGAEKIIQVTADTKAEAEAKARKQGLLVSAVHESQVVTPAEALDEMVGNTIRERTRRASTAEALADVAPAPVEYRSSRTPNLIAPNYGGLKFASIAVRIFALLFYLAGILGLLMALLMFGEGISSGRAGFGVAAGVTQFVISALGPLAAGAIMHGLSASCDALRDIARNSYRI